MFGMRKKKFHSFLTNAEGVIGINLQQISSVEDDETTNTVVVYMTNGKSYRIKVSFQEMIDLIS